MKLHTLTLAAITSAALATTASADSFFSLNDHLDRTSTLELGQVRAEGDGIIHIYDYHRGKKGALLGTEAVTAGANFDVHVGVGRRPVNDVVAELVVNGRIVATQEYEIDRF